MADRVSIREVAVKAGVSPGTVSNVLSGRKPVNENLAERVRNAARELGYATDRAASQLRSGKARIVAVLVPDLDNPFFTSIVAAIEVCLRGQDYETIIASSNGSEAVESSRLSAILAWRPAGIVIVPCSDGFPGRALVEQARVPYVIADRVLDEPGADRVGVDNEDAGAIGVRHLLDLGHERILVAASVLDLNNIRERVAGAFAVFNERGLPAPYLIEGGADFETAIERVSGWLARNDPPTAILALTNFATLGVLGALAQRGLNIPGDMSVIGFDDYAWMRTGATPLTAIAQPVREMGEEIWGRLKLRIAGDTAPPSRVRLSCELKIRASTKRLSTSLQRSSRSFFASE